MSVSLMVAAVLWLSCGTSGSGADGLMAAACHPETAEVSSSWMRDQAPATIRPADTGERSRWPSRAASGVLHPRAGAETVPARVVGVAIGASMAAHSDVHTGIPLCWCCRARDAVRQVSCVTPAKGRCRPWDLTSWSGQLDVSLDPSASKAAVEGWPVESSPGHEWHRPWLGAASHGLHPVGSDGPPGEVGGCPWEVPVRLQTMMDRHFPRPTDTTRSVQVETTSVAQPSSPARRWATSAGSNSRAAPYTAISVIAIPGTSAACHSGVSWTPWSVM